MTALTSVKAMSRPDNRGDFAEVQREMTSAIALLLVAIGGVALWLVPTDPVFPSRPFYVLCVFFIAALTAYMLRLRAPAITRALILLGPSLTLAMAMSLLGYPTLPYLAFLIVAANGTIDQRLGVAAAVLNSATVYLLVANPEQHLPILALLWLTVAMQLISSHALFSVLAWAWNSQERAGRLLEELRVRQGQLNHTLASLTEASRRLERTNRELSIARQEAQEARALKEQLVANVSHELRTPLNLVVGFAEMMFASPESYRGVIWTPELESDVGEIYLASRHLQSLVNDILDLSRIDAARLPMFREMADIGAIVADAVATVAPLLRQRGLWWRVEQPESLPLLFVDRTRIRQVMLNLLNNAARFTDEGGITLCIAPGEAAITVSVHDTGLGIPPDKLEAVFEEFRQVESGPRGRGGTGLGLPLSRQFVALHGGSMWLESKLGTGSTFFFSLPLPDATPQTVALRHTPDIRRPDWSRAPLVVVDPDLGIAEMLSRHLDRPTLAARSLREAEDLVDAAHPVGIVVNQSPDVAAETWLGPIGPLTQRYGVPIVRCSIASPSWLQLSSGLDDCLSKPVTRETVTDAVSRFCPQPGRILVVDDDPGFVSLMQRMLELSPAVGEVLTAYTASEALRVARDKAPQLVFLDLLMPDMDGFALLRALREEPGLEDTRVVAITATSYAEDILMRRANCLTLTSTRGLSAGAVTELLKAVVTTVHPDYLGSDATRPSV